MRACVALHVCAPVAPPAAIFDGIFKRGEKQLMLKQAQVKAASEAAWRVGADRDKVRATIDTMKRDADAERADFELKWRQISQVCAVCCCDCCCYPLLVVLNDFTAFAAGKSSSTVVTGGLLVAPCPPTRRHSTTTGTVWWWTT